MASITKHPILKHPERYLKGKKFHSKELYKSGFYNVSSLNSNVIAQGLSCTKSNGLKYRFPVGGMIRLMVDRIENETYLIPNLKNKESIEGLSPSNYIINNEKFLDFIIKTKQYRRFIPQKFRFKNEPSIVNKVQLLPNFNEVIHMEYLSKFKALLKKASSSGFDQDGIIFSDKGDLLGVKNSKISINITIIDKALQLKEPLFVSFKDNEELCYYAIALANYYY